jgi:hypothetical protein
MAARRKAARLTAALARRLRLLVLDCDGVLTDGALYFGASGEQLKVFHVRDGHGINTKKVHVRRAGNQPGNPGENKKKVLHDLIKKHGYTKVHLYDDSTDNLKHFKSLKADHPNVEFHAHHVEHDPETGNVNITTTSVIPKEKKNV